MLLEVIQPLHGLHLADDSEALNLLNIYLSLNQIDEGGEFIVIRAVRRPLVTWIWISGFILALGTLYAVLPPRSRVPARQREAVSA